MKKMEGEGRAELMAFFLFLELSSPSIHVPPPSLDSPPTYCISRSNSERKEKQLPLISPGTRQRRRVPV